MPSLELGGRAVAQCRVQALGVVDLLDEGTDAALGFMVIAIEPPVDLLGLERLHEALGLGVVVGNADPSSARPGRLILPAASAACWRGWASDYNCLTARRDASESLPVVGTGG
jgi:hypothetical protein